LWNSNKAENYLILCSTKWIESPKKNYENMLAQVAASTLHIQVPLNEFDKKLEDEK